MSIIKISRLIVFFAVILISCFVTVKAQAKYSYNENEIEMLAKTIMAEAGAESMDGKVAVANVVLNRVNGYNSSIEYIVNVANQFAYSSSTVANADCYTAAMKVLDDELWLVPTNCYYFKTSPPPSDGYATWTGNKDDIRIYWGKIGGHYFYLRDPDGKAVKNEPQIYTIEYETPRYGTKPSDEVVEIQKLLNECGYEIETDGYFGKSTDSAVKEMQEKYNLTQDGIVGDETLMMIKGEVARIAEEKRVMELQEKNKLIRPYLTSIFNKKIAIDHTDNIVFDAIFNFYMTNEIMTMQQTCDCRFDYFENRTPQTKMFEVECFYNMPE